MPLLKRATRAMVVMLTGLDDDQPAASALTGEIVTALTLHGVHVDIHVHHMTSRRERGEILLSQAADLGADLIVAGAFGHPRVMELVLGGVTHTLLRAMTVPVLMSH